MGKMIFVACAIIIREGKILATQRGVKMSMPGKWEFPGGKIEANETPEECIVREISEELGIIIEPVARLNDVFYDYGHLQITLVPFISNLISGQIQLSEHQQFMWVGPNELHNLEWAEADLGVVNELKMRKV